MSIHVQELTKLYGSQAAIRNLTFTIPQGQIVGFLGPNGAGKSTTMKILTGYLSPSSGRAEVNGTDVATNPLAVKQHVGYLPEHNPLYLEMYVKEFLTFMANTYGLSGAARNNRIDEVIALVGLTGEAHKRIRQLSKGYRQRVGLAHTLIHDPSVLILDEPTTGLDPNQLVEIRQLIRTVGQNKTVILSTHIMQEVEALCDRSLIINRGEIVADFMMADLAASGQRMEDRFASLTRL